MERLSPMHDEYDSIPPTPTSQRPDTGDRAADREIQMIQGIHRPTPEPSLAVTEGDYGYKPPETQRSSLQRYRRISHLKMKNMVMCPY